MLVEGLFEKFRLELNRVKWGVDVYRIVRGRKRDREYRAIQEKEGFINSPMCESGWKGQRGVRL
jgi:hypothetical protein